MLDEYGPPDMQSLTRKTQLLLKMGDQVRTVVCGWFVAAWAVWAALCKLAVLL